MSFGFSYIGLIWLVLLFVPNIIWTKNKPQDYEEYATNLFFPILTIRDGISG